MSKEIGETMQELNKGTNLCSNWHIKRLDECIILAFAFTVPPLICEPNMTSELFVGLSLGITIFLFLLKQLIFASKLKSDSQYQIKIYAGDIDDLTLAMYKSGYILKQWGNDRYIFKTNNWILPNDHFVTKDYGDYCTILGNEAILRYLARELLKHNNQIT